MSTLGQANYRAVQREAKLQTGGHDRLQIEHCTLLELSREFPTTYMSVKDANGTLLACMYGRDIVMRCTPESPIGRSKIKSMFPHMMGLGDLRVAFTITLNRAFN